MWYIYVAARKVPKDVKHKSASAHIMYVMQARRGRFYSSAVEHRVGNPEVIGSTPIGTTMIVKERPVVLYDIEVFPNCFHCTCKDSESHKLYKFEISCRKNQLEELVDFFYTNRTDHIMCGYNNKHYDDIIISYIIHFCSRMKRLGYSRICSSLYYLSKEIISSEKTGILIRLKCISIQTTSTHLILC